MESTVRQVAQGYHSNQGHTGHTEDLREKSWNKDTSRFHLLDSTVLSVKHGWMNQYEPALTHVALFAVTHDLIRGVVNLTR